MAISNQAPEGEGSTTIPRGSTPKRAEARSTSKEVKIWSGLHGNMQQGMKSYPGRGSSESPMNANNYLGGFGIVHNSAVAQARILKWGSTT